jgi:hypothetical protein
LHRAWLAFQGKPYEQHKVIGELRRLQDPIKAFMPEPGSQLDPSVNQPASTGRLLHPYTGAEEYHDTGGVLAHFLSGVKENEYTIVVVGGSVAGAWTMGEENRFRQRLREVDSLRDRPIRVLNYAHAAYKQPQQLMRLAYLLSFGYRPDAVINLDGYNEAAGGMHNALEGRNPVYPGFPIWGVLVQHAALGENEMDIMMRLWQIRHKSRGILRRTFDRGYYRSSILGSLSLAKLRDLSKARALLQSELASLAQGERPAIMSRQIGGPDYRRGEAVVDLIVSNWFESSLSIEALCRERSILYLHALQPALHDPGSKPLTEVELQLLEQSDEYNQGVVKCYPMFRKRGKDLVDRGVAFVDVSNVFQETEEELYFDACHFYGLGNSLLTVVLADAFVELISTRRR